MFKNIFRTANKIGHLLEENSPTINVVLGCCGTVGAVALAFTAGKKANDIVKDYQHDEEHIMNKKIFKYHNVDDEIKDLKVKTGKDLAKVILPVVCLEGASLYLIHKGFKTGKERYFVLATAYTALHEDFENYRERMRSIPNGERPDVYCKTGLWPTEETDDDGLPKRYVRDDIPLGPGCRFFDETCMHFDPDDPEENKRRLLRYQDLVQAKLKKSDYIMLSDVFDMIGFIYDERKIDAYAKTNGWVFGDIVDFGIFSEVNRRFVNGLEAVALLNFNTRPIPFKYI